MITKEITEQLKNEFHEARSVYYEFAKRAEDLDRDFLNVKLAAVAFIGVVYTIVVGNNDLFTNKFLAVLSLIITFAFTLLPYEFWRLYTSYEKSLLSINRHTLLANIRHAAALQSKNSSNDSDRKQFMDKSAEAENLAERDNKIVRLLRSGLSPEEIVRELTNEPRWRVNFLVWGLLIVSVPVLLILSLLHIL